MAQAECLLPVRVDAIAGGVVIAETRALGGHGQRGLRRRRAGSAARGDGCQHRCACESGRCSKVHVSPASLTGHACILCRPDTFLYLRLVLGRAPSVIREISPIAILIRWLRRLSIDGHSRTRPRGLRRGLVSNGRGPSRLLPHEPAVRGSGLLRLRSAAGVPVLFLGDRKESGVDADKSERLRRSRGPRGSFQLDHGGDFGRYDEISNDPKNTELRQRALHLFSEQSRWWLPGAARLAAPSTNRRRLSNPHR